MAGSSGFPKLRGNDPQQDRIQDGIAGQLGPIGRALAGTPIMGAAVPTWVLVAALNGFAAIAGAAQLAYHRDSLRYVHGKGGLVHAAGCAGGTVIYVLPLTFRPAQQQVLAVRGAGGAAQAVVIEADGRVRNDQALAAGDTIYPFFNFLAEQ